MIGRRARAAVLAVLVLGLGACEQGGGDGSGALLAGAAPAEAAAAAPPDEAPAAASPDRLQAGVREMPDAFSVSGQALWDGRPTLPGLWVAHPNTPVARRVRMRNADTGTVVDGALLPQRSRATRAITLSAEAAAALGMRPRVPARIALVAIRQADLTAELAAAASGAAPVAQPVAPAAAVPPAPPVPTAAAPDAGALLASVDAAAGTVSFPEPPEATEAPAASDAPVAISPPPTGAAVAVPAPPAPATATAPAETAGALLAGVDAAAVTVAFPDPPASEPAATTPPAAAVVAAAPAAAAPAGTAEALLAGVDAAAGTVAFPEPGAGEPAAAAEPAAPAPAIADGMPYIQAGYFAEPDHAADLVRTLGRQGIPAVNTPATVRGATLHRVRAGPFPSTEARDRALERLRAIGITDARPSAG